MTSDMATLPQFLREMLVQVPQAGEGVHSWLFRVARQLHAHVPASDIIALLERSVASCGRRVSRSEIVSAVQNSIACAWQPGGVTASLPVSRWPKVNTEQREAIVRDGGGLVDLWESSPVRFEDNTAHTEAIIDTLFPGNLLLCAGRRSYDFATRSREEWRGKLAALQLIVPSPMTSRTGRTQEGKESAHALSIMAPRRFLVVEQDLGTIDEQAAVLFQLARYGPLAVAVHSGSKSIHGWFYCAGQPEEGLHRFMRYSVSLGADPATWTCSQFVRMPDGTRDNGKRQALYYFNPAVLQ